MRWNHADIKGDHPTRTLHLEGSFDDDGMSVFFTAPLYGSDIDLTVYELVDDEMGDRITVAADTHARLRKIVNDTRADIRDGISRVLSRYEE